MEEDSSRGLMLRTLLNDMTDLFDDAQALNKCVQNQTNYKLSCLRKLQLTLWGFDSVILISVSTELQRAIKYESGKVVIRMCVQNVFQ